MRIKAGGIEHGALRDGGVQDPSSLCKLRRTGGGNETI